MPITTIVFNSTPARGGVYSTQHYAIKFVRVLRQVSGFPGYSGFPSIKTDRHDITDILLKVALNIITLTYLQDNADICASINNVLTIRFTTSMSNLIKIAYLKYWLQTNTSKKGYHLFFFLQKIML